MLELNLLVRCGRTEWGDAVGVLGEWNSWSKGDMTLLNTNSSKFPEWTAQVRVSPSFAGRSVEYKYVIAHNGAIREWEPLPHGGNRVAVLPSEGSVVINDGHFGRAQPAAETVHREPPRKHVPAVLDPDVAALTELERALVRFSLSKKSWRERLAFVRTLFTDQTAARAASFDSENLQCLASVCIYLAFLSSGQLVCAEDGGHHRPNHHASEARRLDAALSNLTKDAEYTQSYVPYIVRRIYPLLPSYAEQFTVAVPLTRIRDIAHRSDIPHDLKQQIKHSLQNKLHRCAGPEDLETSQRLLEQVQKGGYSQAFVDQLKIFHEELCDFFNASSLDKRLRYLADHYKDLRHCAEKLLDLKRRSAQPVMQLEAITSLRRCISTLDIMQLRHKRSSKSEASDVLQEESLPSEHVQKVRLADIALETFAFPVLASVANAVAEPKDSADWKLLLRSLSLAFENIELAWVDSLESRAIQRELAALANAFSDPSSLSETEQRVRFLRTKAAVDRARRATARFSVAVSGLYAERAPPFADALGIEARAARIFAESEIRANIAFQASRVADSAAAACRRVLKLPPWDPLLTGKASGRLEYVSDLADVAWDSSSSERTIVIVKDADGDEDIPSHVSGIVLGRPLAHLSHLAVRARQASVVFVCAEDPVVFEQLWNKKFSVGAFSVNMKDGLEYLREEQPETKTRSSKSCVSALPFQPPCVSLDDLDMDAKHFLSMIETTKRNASAKCAFVARLSLLATRINGLFAVPRAVCLSHSAFFDERKRMSAEYDKLVQAYESIGENAEDDDAERIAHELRNLIMEDFTLSVTATQQLQAEFAECGNPVMVRSSANAEDLESMSGAGLYDSVANVRITDEQELCAAVKQVWASLWTKRASSSRRAYQVPHSQVSMAVLVQVMVNADLSFVAFSRDPVYNDLAKANKNYIYVEIAVGMGETLASGVFGGTPYRFRVDRDNWNVQVVAMASHSKELVPDTSGGLQSKVVDYSQQLLTTSSKFRENLVRRIARTVLLIEMEFGGPQDIEGAFVYGERQGDEQLFVVQSRPQVLD